MKEKQKKHKEIKIGLIGCGIIAEWAHLPVLTGPDIVIPDQFELGEYIPYKKIRPTIIPKVIALCDIHGERANILGDRYNINRRYTSYQTMLDNEDLDALLVTAGPKLNMEIIPQAVERGLHIFVEKPMTGTLREALKVQRILRGRRIVFQIGFMRRFYYGYRTAKRLLGSELGQVEALNARFWSGDRDDLLNNSIHIFDIIQFLGGSVKETYARFFGSNIVTIVQFESGAIGTLFLTGKIDSMIAGVWHSMHERVEVIGSKNRVLIVENGRRVHISGQGNPLSTWDPPQVLHWVTGYNIAGFADEWRHFLNCIASGKPSGVGVESGIYSIRLKEGIERSLDEHRTVDLQEYQSQLELLSREN